MGRAEHMDEVREKDLKGGRIAEEQCERIGKQRWKKT